MNRIDVGFEAIESDSVNSAVSAFKKIADRLDGYFEGENFCEKHPYVPALLSLASSVNYTAALHYCAGQNTVDNMQDIEIVLEKLVRVLGVELIGLSEIAEAIKECGANKGGADE